ncbi:MAG: amino acid permease [Planctomycetes bacterium]|nr:amino acid permease [Planctomycetota bacterium]
MTDPADSSPVRPRLGLWDAVSIIVGIVVGTAIFKTPHLIFSCVEGPWQGLGAWALGGVLALIGAFCYAELATTYPRLGGDYVYLTRAFGRPVGFLFGWANLTVVLSGSIAAMAYAFAHYGGQLFGLDKHQSVWLAIGSVVVLCAMNLAGVVCGKSVQNFLSIVKLVGIGTLAVAGLAFGGKASMAVVNEPWEDGFGLAMVFVFYAYGGWNDAAFVAAEVRDRDRNMPRALVLSITIITVLYLLVNAGYLWALGFEGLRASQTPATDVLTLVAGDLGGKMMSLLVMISALGAINGLIFTGSRIYAGMGAEHRVFSVLGRWHPTLGVPVWSIVAESVIAIGLILLVGTQQGRDLFDGLLVRANFSALKWSADEFETLVAGTAPVFWTFFLLTGLSVFILRFKHPDLRRPYSIPFYPLPPIIFCLTSGWMLYRSLSYAKMLSLLGWIPLAVGGALYLFIYLVNVLRPKRV